MNTCPECGSKKLEINKEDGVLCKACGLVIGENYYSGSRMI